jgi:selenocysteine lyase/cysteine desulfurase
VPDHPAARTARHPAEGGVPPAGRSARGRPRYEALGTAGADYPLEASRRLGLGDAGGVRAGLAPHTDPQDVDRLVEAVGDAVATLRR